MRNDQHRAEIQRLRQQFELSMRDVYQAYERNFTRYLIEEQMKGSDLWAALLAWMGALFIPEVVC